jgi:hypothetical protein
MFEYLFYYHFREADKFGVPRNFMPIPTEVRNYGSKKIPAEFHTDGIPWTTTSHIYILALILRLPVLGPVCSGGHGVG